MSTENSTLRSFRGSVLLGVSLIVLGLLAIAAPFFAGVAVIVLLGWLVILAGAMHFVYAWSERGAGVASWQVLIGLAYVVAGFYLLLHPILGLMALTLVLGCYMVVEGALNFLAWYRLRPADAALYYLIDGVASILLAALIFFHWPSGSRWILGAFAGISILMSGVLRLAFPVRQRALSRRALRGTLRFRRRSAGRTVQPETPQN